MKYHTRQMKNTTTHKNWYKIEEQKVRGKNPQIFKEQTKKDTQSWKDQTKRDSIQMKLENLTSL
jgi:hypothetical protein